MKLYRARRISDRPTRHPAFLGTDACYRVRGRWFTSVLENAIAHGETLNAEGAWEIVCVETDDTIAKTFRVATTPRTPCGLTPINHAQDPETEYVLPTWIAMSAQVVAASGTHRQRDYLDMDRPANVIVADLTPGIGEAILPVAV